MPTTPSQLVFTEEVDSSTIGDQVPNPPSGSLTLFPNNNGNWYMKNSSGVVSVITGLQAPVALSSLATEANNTLVGNASGSTASPSALSVATVNAMLASQEVVDVTQTAYNTTGTPVVLNNSTSGVCTTNVAALNSIFSNAPAGSKIWFPTGTCFLNAGLTALTKDFAIEGVHGQSTIAWANTPITNTTLLPMKSSGFYSSIRDIIFQTFVTMTTNYVIDVGANVNFFIEGCLFSGGTSNPFAGLITFSDATNGANGAVIRAIWAQGWTGNAIYIHGQFSSPYISDLELLGNNPTSGAAGFATNGILCDNGGAILMADSGIVKCQNNVNLTAATGNTLASVFCVNCFLDQGSVTSLLISGTGSGVNYRSHFVACWFTTANVSGANAISIPTGSTSVMGSIEFQDCWVVNVSGTTGTCNGFLIANCSDLTISNCVVAGWLTAGISIAAATGSVTAPQIVANTIGAISAGVAGNGTGIITSGAMKALNIVDNLMLGNTTPITDTSTVTVWKNIANNPGALTVSDGSHTAAAQSTTTTAAVASALTFQIGAGETVRFSALVNVVTSSTTTTGGIKVGVTGPAGAVGAYKAIGATAADAAAPAAVSAAGTQTLATLLGPFAETTTTSTILIEGVMTATTTTPGTGTIVFAANVTTVTVSIAANSGVKSFQC